MDARFAEVSARFGEQASQSHAGLADLERRMTMRLGAVCDTRKPENPCLDGDDQPEGE